MALGIVALVLVPFVLIVLLAVQSVRAAKRRALQRQSGLAAYAASREWRFSADGTGLESRFPGDPFGRGHSRRAYNVVEGRFEGRPFLAFDYTYVTGTGDDRRTHTCSVLTMHFGDLGGPAPMLQVSPQGSVGRFFNRLLGNDFVVGIQPFDDDYLVRTNSPDFARDVLSPRMVGLLGPYVDRGWRMEGTELIMFRAGQHVPQEVDAVLGFMRAILDTVPAHVWSRLRGER